MSFRTIVILAYILFIVIQIYFTKKSVTTIKNLFPSISKRNILIGVVVSSVLFYLYPISRLLHNTVGLNFPGSFLYDYFVLYPFWIILMVIGQSMILLVPLDLLKLILFPLYKKHSPKSKRIYFQFTFIVILISLIYAPIRVIYDHNVIEVRNIDFAKDNLSTKLENFKITFISDIQADRFTNDSRLGKFLTEVNNTNPDLILIAGDLITGSPDYIEYSAKQLGTLKAKYGVYSCVGDHDNWSYRRNVQKSRLAMKTALENQNIKFGDDEKEILNINGVKVNLTFITNTYSGSISPAKLDSLSNGKGNYDLKVFLTHQPREHLLETAINNNYDLYLCGHTHGGQISIWTPFGYLSPTLLETNKVRGDFWFDNLLMVVTRGWGYSLAPIRYNSTPEIVTITLKAKP